MLCISAGLKIVTEPRANWAGGEDIAPGSVKSQMCEPAASEHRVTPDSALTSGSFSRSCEERERPRSPG